MVAFFTSSMQEETMKNISVIESGCADLEDIIRIFYRAVHEGTKNHYDDVQRHAWAPKPPEKERWREMLASQQVWVAMDAKKMAGFITLRDDGCIDLFFVDPDYMGTGVSTALYDKLIFEARQKGMKKLFSEASYLARSFFLKKGWQEKAQQKVTAREVELTNFVMEYRL